jgi:hypothetical protein
LSRRNSLENHAAHWQHWDQDQASKNAHEQHRGVRHADGAQKYDVHAHARHDVDADTRDPCRSIVWILGLPEEYAQNGMPRLREVCSPPRPQVQEQRPEALFETPCCGV